jgi:hypothetical protein
MRGELYSQFKTILSNQQISQKQRQDVFTSVAYNFNANDPRAIELYNLALAQPDLVAPPIKDVMRPVADYSRTTLVDNFTPAAPGRMAVQGHPLEPGLLEEV